MKKQNWWELKRKNPLGFFFMRILLRLPVRAFRALCFPIGFFYWIFSRSARHFSADFFSALSIRPRTLSHVISFALNLVENVQAWAGKIDFSKIEWQNDDVSFLVSDINANRGTLLLISHLGNAQMLKALAFQGKSGTEKKMEITTIMDEAQSRGFGALQKSVNDSALLGVVDANNIGPETVFLLQEKIEKGGTVVIAGDRLGSHSSKTIRLDFLGKKADFPYGVFLLASLLDCPTYFVTGLRTRDLSISAKYKMFVKKSHISFDCSKKEREERIRLLSQEFSQNLEILSKTHPLQWYNFFAFFSE